MLAFSFKELNRDGDFFMACNASVAATAEMAGRDAE